MQARQTPGLYTQASGCFCLRLPQSASRKTSFVCWKFQAPSARAAIGDTSGDSTAIFSAAGPFWSSSWSLAAPLAVLFSGAQAPFSVELKRLQPATASEKASLCPKLGCSARTFLSCFLVQGFECNGRESVSLPCLASTDDDGMHGGSHLVLRVQIVSAGRALWLLGFCNCLRWQRDALASHGARRILGCSLPKPFCRA